MQFCSADPISISGSFDPFLESAENVSINTPFPVDGSWVLPAVHVMNCTVSNDEGYSMDVYFYWGNTSLIDSDLGVANDSVANVTVGFNYTRYSNYSWYVVVNVSGNETNGDSWWFKGEAYDWDIIRDADIDYLDASSLTSTYGDSGSPGWIRDDINDDGDVDYLDASALTSYYGDSY